VKHLRPKDIQKLSVFEQIEAASEVDRKGVGRIVRTLDDPALGVFPGLPRIVMNEQGQFRSNGHKPIDKTSKVAEHYRIRKFYNSGRVVVVEYGEERKDSHKGFDDLPHDPRLAPNHLVAWQLYGFSVSHNDPKTATPAAVRKALAGAPCVFSLSTGESLQIDHKYGREDQRQHPQPAELGVEHFQRVTRERNMFKKGQCQKCRNTNRRFDARQLGFCAGWTAGGASFNGAKEGCRGCYLFDPVAFSREISSGFKPKKS